MRKQKLKLFLALKKNAMKFRLVFETKTKNGHPIVLKFNVPPSKHLGLINFLKIASGQDQDVSFTVEKVDDQTHELSKVRGHFKLEQENSE